MISPSRIPTPGAGPTQPRAFGVCNHKRSVALWMHCVHAGCVATPHSTSSNLMGKAAGNEHPLQHNSHTARHTSTDTSTHAHKMHTRCTHAHKMHTHAHTCTHSGQGTDVHSFSGLGFVSPRRTHPFVSAYDTAPEGIRHVQGHVSGGRFTKSRIHKRPQRMQGACVGIIHQRSQARRC